MIEDALKSTRGLHRFILTASLLTLLFSLSLVPPGPRIAIRDAIGNLIGADLLAYDEFTRSKVGSHVDGRRVSATRWRADTFRSVSSIQGLDRVIGRIVNPLHVSKFEIKGTALGDLRNATLSHLQSSTLIQELSRNIEVVQVSFPSATQQLEAILGPYDRQEVSIVLEVLDAEEADWASRSRGFEGTRLFSVSSWPELPGGNRWSLPSSFRLPLSFPAEVDHVQLQGTAFIDWIESEADLGEVVSVRFGQLAFADGAYWTVSAEQRGATLQQLHETLSAELAEGDPRRLRVNIFGAQVPAVLVVIASPLVLLMLSYSLAMHTVHLKRLSAQSADEIRKFAWLPLTLRASISWVSATSVSVIIVPSASLWVLRGRLTEFESIDWSLAPVVMCIAHVGIAGFGLVSLYSIRGIRAAVEG